MDTGTVAQQADALARAWSPPSAPRSWELTAAMFATLRDDPELLGLTTEIPDERLPPLLFSAATTLLVRRLAPEPLARSYPAVGAPQPPLSPTFGPEYRAFCLEHRDELRALCAEHRYQMSEPGRCAHLLPAVALAAGTREVALVDLGTGAGFALALDRYRYLYRHPDGTRTAVGDAASPVTIATETRGPHRPPLPAEPPRIIARVGVDAEPVDLGDPAVRSWLAACVPPEASALTRFERAADVVLSHPVAVRQGDAVDALAELMAELPDGARICLLDAYVHASSPPSSSPASTRSWPRPAASATSTGSRSIPSCHWDRARGAPSSTSRSDRGSCSGAGTAASSACSAARASATVAARRRCSGSGTPAGRGSSGSPRTVSERWSEV